MSSSKRSVISPDCNARFEYPDSSYKIRSAETGRPTGELDDCKTLDQTLIVPETVGFFTPPERTKHKFPVIKYEPCPWDCGVLWLTNRLPEHLQVCTHQIKSCDYKGYGCKFMGNRAQRTIHCLAECEGRKYEDEYVRWFNQLHSMFPKTWTSLLSEDQTYLILNPFTSERVQCKLKVIDGFIRVNCLHDHRPIPNFTQCVPVPLPSRNNIFRC